jgi:hypothetical protein
MKECIVEVKQLEAATANDDEKKISSLKGVSQSVS